MSKQQNIKCFLDTQQISRSYRVPKTNIYSTCEILNTEHVQYNNNTKIQVINDDCIQVAKDAAANSGKVCMLNMASTWKAGGGVSTGQNAQEETLCRRSNLYSTLVKMEYPMPEFSCFLSKQVTFFKDSVECGYKISDEPFSVDVISIAAYRISGKSATKQQLEGTLTKIRLLLLVSAAEHNDTIVLSALGCGAYGGDPNVVSKLFYQVLVEENYKKYFKDVIFAIIDDQNAKKSGNYAPFAELFANLI